MGKNLPPPSPLAIETEALWMPAKKETGMIAAMEFNPWSAETIAALERQFSHDTWALTSDSPVAADLRIAAAIMGKTKAELIQAAETLDTSVFELLDHLEASADQLRRLVDLLSAARVRQQVAAASYIMRRRDGGDDLRFRPAQGKA